MSDSAHRQPLLGQSAPSPSVEKAGPRCPAPPTSMNFFSQNYSGDVNIHSGPNPIFHPLRAGIVIHIASESLFTSLRNDYSHAPESAVERSSSSAWCGQSTPHRDTGGRSVWHSPSTLPGAAGQLIAAIRNARALLPNLLSVAAVPLAGSACCDNDTNSDARQSPGSLCVLILDTPAESTSPNGVCGEASELF